MDKRSLKERLPLSALIGAAFGLTFFFFGVLQSYAGNAEKFLFGIKDFIVPIGLLTLTASVLSAALILFSGPKLGKWIAGAVLGVTSMGFAQAAFLNRTHALAGDDPSAFALEHSNRVLNAAIWAAAALVFLAALILVRNTERLRTAAVILALALIGMQAVGTVTDLIRTGRLPQKEYYLTTEGMTEVSPEKNIIVIVLDRFDVMYYDEAVTEDAELFAPLTGFTFYRDNISRYSRTYPGAATMICGEEGFAADGTETPPDLGAGAEQYLNTVYEESRFIKDLKANDYRIKLYMPGYYTYRSGSQLKDVLNARNAAEADSYHITDRGELVRNLLRLSLYKSLPRRLKPYVAISTDSFNHAVSYDNGTLFETDDAGICAAFRDSAVKTDGSRGNFIYLHMGGCHDPYLMDEHQQRTENGTALGQLRGDLKMIYDWFDQLKALGLYENATIVITGDHPWAHNDSLLPAEPRLTALFVKEAGRSEEALAFSDAQVSQENLTPTLVKSAGLETAEDYGPAYSEIPEGEPHERRHYFEWDHDGETYLVPFTVNGNGGDFANWHAGEPIRIGDLYR